MKTSTYKYFLLFGFVVFLIACSTKKNSFVNRNFHAVTTEYNVLYNGELALQAGIDGLKTTYTDNFWNILPIERMQMTEEEMGPTDTKNPNFERAETKATKAIQKHSMNIANSEKNPQMDEAHLLLGKTRYYDNRFIPALEAFNYILYKHPNSDKIYEAKVWREKTNIRLENESVAIKNLKQLLEEQKLEPQVYADANAILAQAYINLESKDSALTVLKKAAATTELKEERARYNFIIGQLYERLNYPDSAFAAYQTVIDMKRKSPRMYVIQAHARQAGQFDFAKGDTLAFMEKYNDLLEDRENRPFLDMLNHQVALFYDKQKNDGQAKKYYNRSLKTKSKDRYLVASNYRNLAEIYFKNAKYPTAGMYYDSTMVNLQGRSREFKAIKKKRDNLADVIKYEAIAQNNDSILHIASLSEPQRITFFEDYIVKLKKQEEREKKRMEEATKKAASQTMANPDSGMEPGMGNSGLKPGAMAKSGKIEAVDNMGSRKAMREMETSSNSNSMSTSAVGGGKFYFYNPSTVAYGKLEFEKRWGKRTLSENWRWSSEQKKAKDIDNAIANDSIGGSDATKKEKANDPRYTAEYYLKQLPTSQKVLDSLATERNFAYYQLGTIYKEKFKEYQRAADKLEKLLVNKPEERLILPAKYNLYKIYQIIDPAKAEAYKNQVLAEYPDSRYAEIIRNPTSETINSGTPESVYASLYKKYESGDLREALTLSEQYVETYTGEDIVSKFEMLKATVTGRVKGLEEYKQALNFVALNYPNSSEGKEAEAILSKEVPNLEKLTFGRPPLSWKIVFKFDDANDPRKKPLTDKIAKFIKEGLNNSITISDDIYTLNENFIVIHGFNSKLAAQDAVSILKDYKTYKVAETPYVISSEDYTVVQVKKNFTEFTAIK